MSKANTQSTEIELSKLNAHNIKLVDLTRLPLMTGWFQPILLLKLLLRVLLSDVFGQYADRRLIEAALDPATSDEHVRRATSKRCTPDPEGAVWVDYVSDLGDGFDATYAIAFLIAQPSLAVGGHNLPRAGMLVMGGDEVYPTALRDDYKTKMRLPYDLAWPAPKTVEKTPLFLLPGNHDWYDGLVNFLAIFCREKPTNIGGWSTTQRRSYFAVEVAPNWWLWGIDIALVRDMDQPQADYFVAIAKAMPENANVILCSAEPGWYKAEAEGDAYRTLSYAAWIATNAAKDMRIPLVLSGDSHHYARYEGEGRQYITSGGGGAFLHGTLDLTESIEAKWLKSEKERLVLKACYPTKEKSWQLLTGNWYFGSLNRSLTLVIAGFYLACAFLLTCAPRLDLATGIFLLLITGLWGYSRYQEGSWSKTAAVSIGHACTHMLVILAFFFSALWLNQAVLPGVSWHWLAWLVAIAVPIMIVGPFLAGWIYGLSLLVGCRHFGIYHNDAFSAMKIDTHCHFLRIRLSSDSATIYPIKLDSVPKRTQWEENPTRPADPQASVFSAQPALAPQLLEDPVVIMPRVAATTSDVKPDAPSVS